MRRKSKPGLVWKALKRVPPPPSANQQYKQLLFAYPPLAMPPIPYTSPIKKQNRLTRGGVGSAGNHAARQHAPAHRPSAVDHLPLRPTAQIFTWDPSLGDWVLRARPKEN